MLRTAGNKVQGDSMKYLLLAAILAVSACATSGPPTKPLTCAYADSHCARGSD